MLKAHINFLFVIFLLLLFGCTGSEDAIRPNITDVDDVKDVEDIPEEAEAPIVREEISTQAESSFDEPPKETTNIEEIVLSNNLKHRPICDCPISLAMVIGVEYIYPSEIDSSGLDSFYKNLIRGACEFAETATIFLLCEKKLKLSWQKQLICMGLASGIPKICPE